MLRTCSILIAITFLGVAGHMQVPRRAEAVDNQGRSAYELTLHVNVVDSGIPSNEKFQFARKDEIHVEVLATNLTSKPIVLTYSKGLVAFLPILSRGETLISYSPPFVKRLAASDRVAQDMKNPKAIVLDSTIAISVAAKQQVRIANISLVDYYDSFEPGIYDVKIKYREKDFEVESDNRMFQVLP
jgi:hypothetical protein